jgi:hypothetical protein
MILICISVNADCYIATVVTNVILISINVLAYCFTAVVAVMIVVKVSARAESLFAVIANVILVIVSTLAQSSVTTIVTNMILVSICMHKLRAVSIEGTAGSINRTANAAGEEVLSVCKAGCLCAKSICIANLLVVFVAYLATIGLATNFTGLRSSAGCILPYMCRLGTVLLAAAIAGCLFVTRSSTTSMTQSRNGYNATLGTRFRSGTGCFRPGMYMRIAATSSQCKQRTQHKHQRK